MKISPYFVEKSGYFGSSFFHFSVTKQLAEKGIKLEVTESAKDFLGVKGYDEVFGARPLRRAIQDRVEDKLSEELLRGKYQFGDTVVIDIAENEIVIRQMSATVAAPTK